MIAKPQSLPNHSVGAESSAVRFVVRFRTGSWSGNGPKNTSAGIARGKSRRRTGELTNLAERLGLAPNLRITWKPLAAETPK